MEERKIEGELALVKAEDFGEWFSIERAEHENRCWDREEGNTTWCMYSGRISDADVEGTDQDMLDIAAAIEMRGTSSSKRCQVIIEDGRALFCSPRNDNYVQASVPLEVADRLAASIREVLGE